MNICDCYFETTVKRPVYSITTGCIIDYQSVVESRCNGTKEQELCSCNGDRKQCDFYQFTDCEPEHSKYREDVLQEYIKWLKSEMETLWLAIQVKDYDYFTEFSEMCMRYNTLKESLDFVNQLNKLGEQRDE